MTVSILRRVISFRLVPLFLLGVTILYLGVNFVRQASVSHQRSEELHQLEQEIASAMQRTDRLKARLNYVRSPEAAEQWARENGWAKPDEATVVLVVPSVPHSVDGPNMREATATMLSNRDAWWALFFGER